ncbi:type II toxin-antitoxin system HicA family toxin [Candidatus Microgenomates bacterium]|nr:type II toxin-antitoxin system HicA family toxin [Candidatus Microgenomates bacterium]
MASFRPKEIVSILQKLGYIKRRQSGSHVIIFHPVSKITISVPMHSRDVRRGLLLGIIKQAKSTEKEFIKLK